MYQIFIAYALEKMKDTRIWLPEVWHCHLFEMQDYKVIFTSCFSCKLPSEFDSHRVSLIEFSSTLIVPGWWNWQTR
jgi:hypothetical protein